MANTLGRGAGSRCTLALPPAGSVSHLGRAGQRLRVLDYASGHGTPGIAAMQDDPAQDAAGEGATREG